MIILIGLFTLLHLIFCLKLARGWKQIPLTKPKEKVIPFSIVLPVRNESENIQKILRNLDQQSYPKELFEVIVIDDFSEDDTITQLIQVKDSLNLDIQLIRLDDTSKQGKKQALTAGIKAAKHETIITTDADCWFGTGWIKSYNDAFDEHTNMVAGPVAMKGQGLFERMQQVEFAGLIGFGAVTIVDENPSMCSGANLGFRKRAFEEVGGYSNNLFTPSGDDEFLLFNIMRKFPHSAKFMKNENGIVNTSAHKKLSTFLNQRTRWTSKWKHNKNWILRFSAVLFFFDYMISFAAVASAAFGWVDYRLVVGIVVLRFVADCLFIAPINKFLKGRSFILPLILIQIIYPLHVLFMGMNSIFGSYTWKGRKYG